MFGQGEVYEQTLKTLSGLAPNANLPAVVFINDPVAGARYELDPKSKRAVKVAMRETFERSVSQELESKLKQAREALAQSEERLRLTLRSARIGVWSREIAANIIEAPVQNGRLVLPGGLQPIGGDASLPAAVSMISLLVACSQT